MLCYRCGSHVPDGSEACTACGQKFAAGLRGTPTGTFSRRKLAQVEGAPYKVGDLVAERYEIKDVIGQGPIGVVYRALDREIDVEIALKVISPRLMQTPDERRSFAREIRTAKKLSHNNIVKLYDDGQDGERVFFTQQYLDGLTLRRIIDLRKEKGQFFQLRELEPIVTQIAAALDHAAAATRPHGDLKPENVIVLPDLLKVTDFGLSTGLPRQPFVAAQRGRGDRYLAPEFLSGQEIDSRADIYSLGAMVGEMLAGVLPDPGGPPELASRNHDLPHSIEPIYRRAVNANPGARYPRAGELAADLAGLLEGMISSRREPSRSPPPPPSAATRAPPGGRMPEPEVVELADDDLDEVEVPDPRSRAAEVAAGLEAEVVARKPRPPPPPPDEAQEPAPRSNGRASGIREAKPASGVEAKPVSGVREGRPPSGVREGRSSGVRPPPPPSPAEPQAPEPPVARELSLERPPERGAKPPKPEPTPSAPLPLSKPKKPASRGGPSPALLAIAVVLGLGVAFGAFSGWRWWRTEQTAREEQLHRAEVEAHAEQARLDAEERARLAAAGTPSPDAPPVIPDSDRAAAEQASAARLAEEQAAAAKLAEAQGAAGKLAAEKAAAELAAAQKAALEKADAGKAPPERSAAERDAERAEKARLEEERKQAALAAAATPSRAEEEARRAEESRKREEALEAARSKAEEEKTAEVKVAAVTPGGGCPAGMSLVQAGAFKRGVPAGDPMKNFGDLGQESVDVGAYCIDKWEFPNRPKGKPTVRVPFAAAESACKKGGKRICTEEEWEKACKGPGNARFPYGGTFDAKTCNTQDETGTARELADSMSFPRCRSGYGAYDMAGNVAEWTSGSAPAGKVTKGGGADRPDFDSRCAARKGKPAGSREEFLGFRCCADPK